MPNQVLCIAQNLAFDFGGPIMKGTAFSLCLAYYSLLVLSNTTLTSMICYRVVCHGRLVRAQLGRGYSAMYFAVVEVVAGLALPIIISGIAFVVTLGLDSVVNTPIAAVYFMMMVRDFPRHATKQCTRLTVEYVGSVFHRRCLFFGC